jgi:DMSO/TMAO reductase YedYZ molybdopterin-dependent catalytic subunit
MAALTACRPADKPAPTIYQVGSYTRPPPTPTLTSPFGAPPVTLPPPPNSVPITSQKALYVNSYRGTPDVATWQNLRIDGLVAQPVSLSMADIRALPPREAMYTLSCISNPVGGGLIGNVVWTGVDLGPLLTRVGTLNSAKYAHFEALDGYTTSVKLEWLAQFGVMLAYAANSEPLTPEHGAPLRLFMPGLYGQKMPKWITRIHLAAEDRLGYWEQEHRGWSNTATIKTHSQIRVPSVINLNWASAVRLEGYAFAGNRKITRVEVGFNGGTPRPAAVMIGTGSSLAWTWWHFDWYPPTPGLYRVTVHATDETGFTQERLLSGTFGQAFPDGTDAVHQVTLKLS